MTEPETEATFVIYDNDDGEIEVRVMDTAQLREFFKEGDSNRSIVYGVPESGVNFREMTCPQAIIIRGRIPASVDSLPA